MKKPLYTNKPNYYWYSMKTYKNYIKKYNNILDFIFYLFPLLAIIHISLVGRYQTKLMFSEIFVYWLSLFCAPYTIYKLFNNDILKTTATIGISTIITVLILGTYNFFGSIAIIFSWAFVFGLIPSFLVTIIKNPYKTQKTINNLLSRIIKFN